MADQILTVDCEAGEEAYRDPTPEEVTEATAESALAAQRLAATELAATNRVTLAAASEQALQTNRDFRALGTPTNAQVVAEVRALALQNNAIIRLFLNLLESTD